MMFFTVAIKPMKLGVIELLDEKHVPLQQRSASPIFIIVTIIM